MIYMYVVTMYIRVLRIIQGFGQDIHVSMLNDFNGYQVIIGFWLLTKQAMARQNWNYVNGETEKWRTSGSTFPNLSFIL